VISPQGLTSSSIANLYPFKGDPLLWVHLSGPITPTTFQGHSLFQNCRSRDWEKARFRLYCNRGVCQAIGESRTVCPRYLLPLRGRGLNSQPNIPLNVSAQRPADRPGRVRIESVAFVGQRRVGDRLQRCNRDEP